ncbi:alpha-ketoglutarate-dependent dioxygenase alkB homolog 6-like [Diadema antillarum]|uniref:alpha-ketoglutarate-dependent dioxygenase alkB homolog 6-like n=1 Tax=Diadema antillarum TaxID=105358 RepID=UPI003A846FF8
MEQVSQGTTKSQGDNDIRIADFQVKNVPDVVYYIPNFISEEEEKYLLSQVYAAPKPKWKQLSHRRLQNWGGLPHPKGMIAEGLPKWLELYTQKVASLGVFEDHVPNHVLVNEYQPGQGIMPHEDGPLFYPTVTTISLGSHTFLDFYHRRNESREHNGEGDRDASSGSDPPPDTEPFMSLLLEPRSLLVLQGSMYTSHLHGITERATDSITDRVANLSATRHGMGEELMRTCRVSLTIRFVPRTLKMKLLFGKR